MKKPSAAAAEQTFFTALVEADEATLGELLADDFLLVDVMTGSEVSKAALLEVVGGKELRFKRIERVEHRVREYGMTAVITGRTDMQGRFGNQAFRVQSRYTHVFIDDGARWRMVSAQGTEIAPARGAS